MEGRELVVERSAVVLKSNPYGIIVSLDPDLPFADLKQAVGEKFRISAAFFKDAKLVLTFRGRELTREQENLLVEEIVQNSRIQVVCILDENQQTKELYRTTLERAEEKRKESEGCFYRGTLRSGQVLEMETSVVIIGDVNPGAQVVSKGSIVVLGCCMGNLYAGASGDRNCFAAALTMKPMQIRIADRIARSAIVKRKDSGEYPIDPKIAFIREDHLQFRPITSEALGEYLTLPGAEGLSGRNQQEGEATKR